MQRDRLNQILSLALPIMGGLVSQNILNLVDTAMVGHLGPNALAAVGLASFANFMAGALLMGMSAGVQAMASRRMGEGREGEAAVPLNGGLFLSLAMGLPLTGVLIWFTPEILGALNTDEGVLREGVPYLEARLICLVAVGMNFSFRGYWNGVSLSTVYLRTLVFMHVINVVLNYLLIFGSFGFPELGTLGSGLGTTIATFLGTAYYFIQAFRRARPRGFFDHLPRGETMATMLRISIPSSIQTFFFAAGFTAMFWIIGRVGTTELAAANVLVNVTLVMILPGMGFGMAAATFVGGALGRGEPDDAQQWAWDVFRVAAVVMGSLGLAIALFAESIFHVFTGDLATIAVGSLPLRLVGALILMDAAGMVFMQALYGAGAARPVMVVSIGLQWFLFMPFAWLVGPELGLGLIAIWSGFIGYRALQALTFVAIWQRGHWKTIKV